VGEHQEHVGPTVAPGVEALVGTVTREFTSDPVSLRHIREYLAGTGASTAHLPRGDDAEGIAAVVAPPLFFLSACRPVVSEDELLEDGQHTWVGVPGIDGRSAVAGTRAEFLGEVRVGDVLHATQRLVSVTTRKGRSGPLVFADTETEYENQRGEPVARHRITFVFR
jgi:N-terminal half of MaoC dehydratase